MARCPWATIRWTISIRALNRIVAYQTPVRLTPAVDRFFKAQARDQTGPGQAWLSDAAAALKTKEGRAWILSEPERNALLRATITPTVLQGSEKTNIIPQEASVELDIRLLPDEDTVAFRRTLERLIADPKIRIESIGDMAPPYSAPLDTDMFLALERVAGRVLPGVPVATPVSAGASDRPYWTAAGPSRTVSIPGWWSWRRVATRCTATTSGCRWRTSSSG